MAQGILVMDNDKAFRSLVCRFIHACGYKHVEQVRDKRQAMHKLETMQPDLLLMDLASVGEGGSRWLAGIRARFPSVQLVVYTVLSPDAAGEDLLGSLGIQDWLSKAQLYYELPQMLERYVRRRDN